MKKHRLNIYPEMKEEAYVSLKNDIEKNGYDFNFPIWIYEDKIIDGWNRSKACKELGIIPTYEKFIGDEIQAINFILRTNNRRDLTSYQRTLLALEFEEMFRETAKENQISSLKKGTSVPQISAKREPIETRKELAKIAKVSHDTISKVKKIQEKAPEEVKAKLATGEVSINAAYKEIKKEEKKEERDKKIQEIKANSINYKQSNIKLLEGNLFNEIKKINDNSIDVLNTDPPYFVLEDSWDTFKNLDDFLTFTENWLKAVKPKLKKTARVYISFAPDYKFHLYKILEKLNFLDLNFGNEIIWVKRNNNKLFKQVRYRLTYEPIIYLYGNKNKLNFTSDTYGETQTDVWEIATPQSNFNEGKYHSAQKPLELYKRIIKTAASNGETVLDCFAGSGTTGIVCKELNINCILIEKDIENIKIIKGRL